MLPLLLAGGALALFFKGKPRAAPAPAAAAAAVTQVQPTMGLGVDLHMDARGGGAAPLIGSPESSLEQLASAAQASSVASFVARTPVASAPTAPTAPVPPPPVERTTEDYAFRKLQRVGVMLPRLTLDSEK